MVKKIVAAIAGVLLANSAYAVNYTLKAKTSTCVKYVGSWEDDDSRGGVQGSMTLSCQFYMKGSNGKAVCETKHADPGGKNPGVNNWGGSIEDGKFIQAELANASSSAVILHVVCDTGTNQCIVRIFNNNTKIGMQCLVNHATVKTVPNT